MLVDEMHNASTILGPTLVVVLKDIQETHFKAVLILMSVSKNLAQIMQFAETCLVALNVNVMKDMMEMLGKPATELKWMCIVKEIMIVRKMLNAQEIDVSVNLDFRFLALTVLILTNAGHQIYVDEVLSVETQLEVTTASANLVMKKYLQLLTASVEISMSVYSEGSLVAQMQSALTVMEDMNVSALIT